ncbi:tetraspanin-5 isoform X3 [Bombus vosnesenskii]|uniref:Tetraspanin n=4 Tax=Bombus TaxID=28641 RepID=A0A6J3LL73_9HYME|nr:tetraspanin-5 isoform X2 [Bombus terrestris]XP_033189374.1 tetraspanin-5 isoform X2 [Bombus vancouverensis nearcticus]XP_033314004.1 tetraspanin-5 isoform X3 [Bombus bifarius]XP_033365456.1 tetraspanin-5 isoform X3 [Bombus vosnesenskii]XP_043592241.1 tetraspanin-5 isoform X4 [Bombus pyrosoma]XP_050476032.1 tetraspanin-5 isoform X3 [Bombus huntii]XP_050593873.1 tetraspanin-5 isoform X2 [Bombus affinis]XP_060819583.1 tetraspanin-5 isoform X2 [Bombus pascuorum]
MPAVRKYRRDTSEVSCCLKYVIFGFNVMFWWLGLGIMAVGVWAWTEKDTFNNLSRLTNVALDPAFILILVGTVTFIIGFTGCVGALRENTCLLATYAIFLALLLLMEMAAGVLGFVFKDWIKSQATGGFQAFIIHYREDPDQQNLIDWIQEDWLQCCGIEGPKDWDRNNYFNCSSSDIGSREACGVPFSCCKRKPNEIIKNKQCGYDVRKPSYNYEVAKVIYEKGCIQAGEEWVERNLLAIVTGAVTTAFAQILGICFAQNLRADIFAQKAKWH